VSGFHHVSQFGKFILFMVPGATCSVFQAWSRLIRQVSPGLISPSPCDFSAQTNANVSFCPGFRPRLWVRYIVVMQTADALGVEG
jgi:hypothetical protein